MALCDATKSTAGPASTQQPCGKGVVQVLENAGVVIADSFVGVAVGVAAGAAQFRIAGEASSSALKMWLNPVVPILL